MTDASDVCVLHGNVLTISGECRRCLDKRDRTSAEATANGTVTFEITSAEAAALRKIECEIFPDPLASETGTGAVVLALVRFALAHLQDPAAGAARGKFPPEPAPAQASTSLRVVAGDAVRVLDRPGHPEGALLVWRDVVAYADLLESVSSLARLTEIPPHHPAPEGKVGTVRRAISALDLSRLIHDLDPVKHLTAIARLTVLSKEVTR